MAISMNTGCEEYKYEKIDSIDNVQLKSEPEPVIFAITIDEWGRSSQDCDSWGLCNFDCCLFCCVDDDFNIVDCDSEEPVDNSGLIYCDPETSEGKLIIKLNPSYTEQEEAIINESIFYVDTNLENDDFIIHKGDYLFDENIGEYGGYNLYVTLK